MPRLDPGGTAASPTPRIDPEALRDGGRAFGAMAERCQVLASALRRPAAWPEGCVKAFMQLVYEAAEQVTSMLAAW